MKTENRRQFWSIPQAPEDGYVPETCREVPHFVVNFIDFYQFFVLKSCINGNVTNHKLDQFFIQSKKFATSVMPKQMVKELSISNYASCKLHTQQNSLSSPNQANLLSSYYEVESCLIQLLRTRTPACLTYLG